MGNFDYTILRILRNVNGINLDTVALDTDMSVGYLSRIERGYIKDVKNLSKRKVLQKYIIELQSKTKKKESKLNIKKPVLTPA